MLFTQDANHGAQIVVCVVVGADDPVRLDEFAVTAEPAGGLPRLIRYVVPSAAANRWARTIATMRGGLAR